MIDLRLERRAALGLEFQPFEKIGDSELDPSNAVLELD